MSRVPDDIVVVLGPRGLTITPEIAAFRAKKADPKLRVFRYTLVGEAQSRYVCDLDDCPRLARRRNEHGQYVCERHAKEGAA